MITFELGEVKGANATVSLGEVDHDAVAARDPEGNITVTLDTFAPDTGDPVKLVLHAENDGRYDGVILVKDGALTFKAVPQRRPS
jgi:hypothetical protein